MSSLDQLSLDALRAHAIETYRAGRGTRPEVMLIEVGGERAVLKDFSRSDPWFGRLIGPLATFREARALRLLEGVPGVPRLIRHINRRAILMQHIDGVPAKQTPKGVVGPEVFERLYGLVEAMHQRGVAHCDLRSGGNTIIDNQGQPYFVDYVSHCVRGRRWNLFLRWAFGKFCEADRVAVARLKKRLAPDLLTGEEQQGLERDRTMLLGRIARFIGDSTRKLSRFILTRKKA